MDKLLLSICKDRFHILAFGLVWMLMLNPMLIQAQSFKLYTPYTKIAVPPGETVDYNVEAINDGNSIRTANIIVSGLPEGWTYTLLSGGYTINQISVLPGEKKTMNLKVNVPFQVEKGNYSFGVSATGITYLPITINVSERGTYKTEITSEQPNMEGHTKANFTFNADIKNSTAEDQLYSLRARAPRGWLVSFKANFKQATSVNIPPNATESITIDVNPPDYLEAGTYSIPVIASTSNTSGTLNLEVVITGSFELEMTTPDGLLSTEITAGDDKRVDIVIRNTGSSVLEDIKLISGKPKDWEAVFEPLDIERLEPGQATMINLSIKASDKAIPGDYVMNMEARTPEVSAKANYRVTVKTSIIAGWFGILIILGVVGLVIYLFRKYGRR